MEYENETGKLIAILADYQDADQDQASACITPYTIPLADIKGFDSLFIPEIVRLFARELGEPLPKGSKVRNIFVENGKKLNVNEIARKYISDRDRKGCKV